MPISFLRCSGRNGGVQIGGIHSCRELPAGYTMICLERHSVPSIERRVSDNPNAVFQV